MDCLVTKNKILINYIVALVISFSILIWFINPEIKFYLGIIQVFLISYYIHIKGYIHNISKLLKFVVYLSAILIIIQITGVLEFVHYWNSFYIEEVNKNFFVNIDLTNILFEKFDDYNSNQVRPNGIFYSSAILSMIIIVFMAYIYSGLILSKLSIFLIGYLVFFSGSKSALIAFIGFSLIQFDFFKNNWLLITLGFIFAAIIHLIIFPGLLVYNFNIDLFFYSFDIRFQALYHDKIGNLINNVFSDINLYLYLLFSFLYFVYILIYKFIKKRYLISLCAIMTCMLTNNHLNSYIAGFFLFPLFWYNNE